MAPQEGALVYNTSSDIIMYYDGSAWVGPQPPAAPAPPAAPVCPATVADVDGNFYKVVQIDGKCWMAENLKVTHYSDNSEITHASSILDWYDKAYCVYDDDAVPGNNGDIYGALYTWSAVMNDAASSTSIPSGVQGVCPAGWHVPSSAEFLALVNFYGGTTVAGDKLKETGQEHWTYDANSSPTNLSGFKALPSGYRDSSGPFWGINENWNCWVATDDGSGTHAYYFKMSYNTQSIGSGIFELNNGCSVRCVQD